jgi:ABC-type nitrate/sulfonate/bicarbonate transport system substrate-binding protein
MSKRRDLPYQSAGVTQVPNVAGPFGDFGPPSWPRNPLSRRQFLAGTGSLLGAGVLMGVLPGCGTQAPTATGIKATNVRTQFNYIKNVENGGWFIADNLGYYRDEGIQQSTFLAGDQVQVEPVLAAGGAEIGQPSFVSRMIEAIQAGADLVMIGVEYQTNPIGFLSLASNPVRTPQDLVGKRLGLQEGTSTDVNTLLKLNGLPVKYTEVKVGYDPAPLIRGDVDAYYAFAINQPLTLKAKGIPYVFVSLSDFGFEDYGNIVVTTKQYLKQHRDVVVAYMRATIKGWEKNEQDPTLAVRLTLDKYGASLGLDSKQQQAQNDAQIPLIRAGVAKDKGLFWFSPDVISKSTYRALQASGKTNLPSVDSIFDLSILEEAYGGKTKLLTT